MTGILPVADTLHKLRIGAASPTVALGDVKTNAESAIKAIEAARHNKCDYLVLPELFLAGATLGSLLNHPLVLDKCKAALEGIAKATARGDITVSIGLPYVFGGSAKSAIALLGKGKVLAIVTEKAEKSPFGFAPSIQRGCGQHEAILPVSGLGVGFANRLFGCCQRPKRTAVTLLCGGINATAKSYEYINAQLAAYSAHMGSLSALSLPGRGESTTSFVFDGYCAIAANGKILAHSTPLEKNPFVFADIFPQELRISEPAVFVEEEGYVSKDPHKAAQQLERMFALQRAALVRRAEHVRAKGFVIGVSGGLDSALALLVACAAADEMGLGRSSVLGISMPGFGTTHRTKNNSKLLIEALGARYGEISVAKACRSHFEDIGHDENIHDVVYENAQARERTKILLSVANKEGLLDVGTGDLSEAALGWTTFGGDHLAQYGVNASLPKTIVRKVTAQVGKSFGESADAVLKDILATPVSPELIPGDNGEIAQKTEELVGSYELHDLFLYWLLQGKTPGQIYDIALGELDFPEEEIYRTLGIFLKRFFAQQFKRNCAPEAPVVCASIAPAVWTMPSDMANTLFMEEYAAIIRKKG